MNSKLFRLNPTSAVPLYVQLVEQIKHAIEICALIPGSQLPGIRTLAQELIISPTTVVKAYSELEHEGVIDIRHGAGAFVVDQERKPRQASRLQAAKEQVHELVGKLRQRGLTEDEIRRIFEAELNSVRQIAEEEIRR